MAERRPQSYANHAHQPRLSTAASVFAILALALFVRPAFTRPDSVTLGLISLTAAVFALVAISRLYIVKLQDRIIRLEMQVRLQRLGLAAEFPRLSTSQLVALRFASDAELAALVQRALAENLTSKQIKAAIRDWQPDYHRT